MKKGKKTTTILSVLFLLITWFSTNVFAQGGGPTPDPSTATSVPIDGGVSLVAAVGIAYGAKKLHDAKKKK